MAVARAAILQSFPNQRPRHPSSMFSFTSPQRLCGTGSRREMLRVGGLLPIGLTLPAWLARTSSAAPDKPIAARAKSCLLIFMEGGSSHIDLCEMMKVRGTQRQMFADRDSGSAGRDWLKITAHLSGRIGLHVPQVDVRRTSFHEDQQT